MEQPWMMESSSVWEDFLEAVSLVMWAGGVRKDVDKIDMNHGGVMIGGEAAEMLGSGVFMGRKTSSRKKPMQYSHIM